MEKKYGIIAIIVGITIIIAGISVSFLVLKSPLESPHNTVYYDIIVKPTIDGEYTLFCPIPVNINNEPELIDEINIIDGYANWKIIENVHGKMLRIESASDLHLRAERKYTDEEYSRYGYLEYSTISNKTEYSGVESVIGQVWMGLNCSQNNTIALKIILGHKSEVGSSPAVDEINASITTGWIKLNVTRTIAAVSCDMIAREGEKTNFNHPFLISLDGGVEGIWNNIYKMEDDYNGYLYIT